MYGIEWPPTSPTAIVSLERLNRLAQVINTGGGRDGHYSWEEDRFFGLRRDSAHQYRAPLSCISLPFSDQSHEASRGVGCAKGPRYPLARCLPLSLGNQCPLPLGPPWRKILDVSVWIRFHFSHRPDSRHRRLRLRKGAISDECAAEKNKKNCAHEANLVLL